MEGKRKGRGAFVKRWIMHVDMDAFFAAVEQRDDPELRGLPVIIGGLSSRGVVSTASYEARKYGVHSAMPISEAKKRCPDGVYLYPNMKEYHKVSLQVQKIFSEFSPLVEMLSIDEGFLDISGMGGLYETPKKLGSALKRRIQEKTQLAASVGIAPNKFVAKIASDIQKPDGLVIVSHEKMQDFLAPLPIERIWGIGKKSGERLHRMGFQTIQDLREKELSFFEREFGAMGRQIYHLAWGIDERQVIPDEERKSLGKETTYDKDLMNREEIHQEISRLSQEVGWRLRREGWMGWTVTLKVRYSPFRTLTRSHTLESPIYLDEEIRTEALRMFEALAEKENVRLLGVTVDKLEPYEEQQTLFFDHQKARKREMTLDHLKKRFGEEIISKGLIFSSKEIDEEEK